jgi:hypothetical protein
MTTQPMNITDGIPELLAKIQRQHPYTAEDLEMSRYKSELTDDESNIYMAYQVWDVRKELENVEPRAFKEITQDIDVRHFKWIKSWIKDFKHIDDVIQHFNLVLEFFRSRHWYSEEYERLATYRKSVYNAYMNIKEEKKDFKSKYSAYV